MISKKLCPRCGSENIYLVGGGETSNYMCKDCGFNGERFPKKIIINKKGGIKNGS
jgi:transposase-like protein